MSCNDNRNSCGNTTMSACVPYTGVTLSEINNDALPCNPNINDIVLGLNTTIKEIREAIDLSEIELECLEACNCDKTTIKGLFEILFKKVCELQSRIEQLENFDFASVPMNINLQGFQNPCFNSSNSTHTILEVLNLLVSEVYQLKNN